MHAKQIHTNTTPTQIDDLPLEGGLLENAQWFACDIPGDHQIVEIGADSEIL